MSLNALQHGLCKIKDSLTRKQIYYMLFHMVRYNDVPGSVVMSIITNNLQNETAEDVLTLVLQSLVSIIISKYLPIDKCDEVNTQMFNIGVQLLESDAF